MKPGTLVIRADASVAIGTGHVMRCLALAQAWQESGGEVLFVTAELNPAITRRLHNEGMKIAKLASVSANENDAHEVAALARQERATWIIVDGYQFDSAYQRCIKNAGSRLLLVDDNGQYGPYCADVILNQNAYARAAMYSGSDPAVKLLLGPDYALLRKEFNSWRNWPRHVEPVARHLLITMGGSDPENFTARVLSALCEVDLAALEITVVIGGANTHKDSLRQLESRRGRKIRFQVDVENMTEVMAGADLAISAAGSTCYELALLQVPMVLFALADNQRPTAQALANADAAIDAGWFDDFDRQRFAHLVHRVVQDYELRCSLAGNARQLVDGFGAHRACQALLGVEAARHESSPPLHVGVS
jgi:UDP-2,4-diacetamido-2,4,6-trideoxy-beta-L-altropyranose hydrolase